MPWLGYFEQIARADVFIFLDSVQYVKREWVNRNRLKGFDDKPFWLSVPVKVNRRETRINEVVISPDQPQWKERHLNSVKTHLGRAAHFEAIWPHVETWLNVEVGHLAELNISGILLFSSLLGLDTRFLRASDLRATGRKESLILNLCKEVGTDVYYSSLGSKVYLKPHEHTFQENGISVVYQNWVHPEYPQLGNQFVSHLSVVDALMNIGPERTRALLMGG
jgi:hypothetical protein